MRTVAPGDWAASVQALCASGFAYLDLLAGIDRLDAIEVVARLVDPGSREHVMLTTRVPVEDPRLASIAADVPAAAWHERETAEMLGVEFVGHPDPRPLLLRSRPERPPLRKDVPLAERVSTGWPGAVDPEAGRRPRRRQLPPGVRESWLPELPA